MSMHPFFEDIIIEMSGQGPIGKTGNSIERIELTSTSGLVDIYTVYFTWGNTTTFEVTNGEAATVTAGTATSLPPGSSPTVTNSGDEHNAIFDFGIPKGDKGDKGDVMYATFEIDSATGILVMNTDDGYDGPDFQIVNDILQVVI